MDLSRLNGMSMPWASFPPRRASADRFIPGRGGSELDDEVTAAALDGAFAGPLGEVEQRLAAGMLGAPAYELNQRPVLALRPRAPLVPGRLYQVAEKVQSTVLLADRVLDAPSLSPEPGRRLVDWGHRNTILFGFGEDAYLYGPETNEILELKSTPGSSIHAAHLLADGRFAALGFQGGDVEIFDAPTTEQPDGKFLRRFKTDARWVNVLRARHAILAAGRADGCTSFYDVRVPLPDAAIAEIQGHEEQHSVDNIAYDPFDEHRFATGADDGKVIVWDNRMWKPTSIWEHEDRASGVAFDPHRRDTLLTTAGRMIGIFDLANGKRQLSFETQQVISQAFWAPTERRQLLTVADDDGVVATVWEQRADRPDSLRPCKALRSAYYHHATCGTHSPDGTQVLTAGEETVLIWSAFDPKQAPEAPAKPPSKLEVPALR